MGALAPFASLGLNAEYGLTFRIDAVGSETGIVSLSILCAKCGVVVGTATFNPSTGEIDGNIPDVSVVTIEVKKQFLERGDIVEIWGGQQSSVVCSTSTDGLAMSVGSGNTHDSADCCRIGHVDPATLSSLPDGWVFE